MKRRLLWGVLALPLLLGALFVGHAQVQSPQAGASPVVSAKVADFITPSPSQRAVVSVWPRPRVWLPPFQQVLDVNSVEINATINGGVAQTEVAQILAQRQRAGAGRLLPVPGARRRHAVRLRPVRRRQEDDRALLDKDEACQRRTKALSGASATRPCCAMSGATLRSPLYPVPPQPPARSPCATLRRCGPKAATRASMSTRLWAARWAGNRRAPRRARRPSRSRCRMTRRSPTFTRLARRQHPAHGRQDGDRHLGGQKRAGPGRLHPLLRHGAP